MLYILGTKSLKEEFVKAGLNITDEYDESISALVMGFDTELTFKKLEDASKLLLLDIDYIATNPDLVCPTEYGYVPDCGSVSIMLENATGRKPKFIGKPEPEMVTIAVERSGVTKEETVMIGDRIYTDVASGINAGVDSILVLSGETTLETAKNSPIRPTYIFPHIKDIYKIIKGEC